MMRVLYRVLALIAGFAGRVLTDTFKFAPATTEPRNPKRGWKKFSGGGSFGKVTDAQLAKRAKSGLPVVRLDEYRDKALPTSFPGDVNKGFEPARSNGLKYPALCLKLSQ